jgi:hypothetical protein
MSTLKFSEQKSYSLFYPKIQLYQEKTGVKNFRIFSKENRSKGWNGKCLIDLIPIADYYVNISLEIPRRTCLKT